MDEVTRAGYLAHSMLSVYRRRIARASAWVAEALALCKKPYVAWSVGGKDSSVMLHLVQTQKPDVLARVLVSGETRHLYPEFDDIIAWWRENTRVQIELIETERVWSTNMSFDEQRKAGRNDIMNLLPTGDLVFLGLRDDESNIRKKANSRGVIRRYAQSRQKNIRGMYVCAPMAKMLDMDIAAYVITNELPVFDIYYELGFDQRTTLRLTGDAVRQMAFQRLRITNPERYNDLLYRFPELNRWNG